MTEPNEAPETAVPQAPAPEAAVAWPALPSELPRSTGEEAHDAAVDALLERLGALPSTPVSGHGEAYAALHDDLLEALNEDVAGQTPQDKALQPRQTQDKATQHQQTQDHSTDRGTPHDDQA
jgi:hypothetical protein